MLEFSVLASGSSGNATFIRSSSTQVLLDAGISGKQLNTRLQTTCQVSLSEIDAVLITHEHIDHIRGLAQVVKQSQAEMYLTQGTWATLQPKLQNEAIAHGVHSVFGGKSFTIGDIRVTPFSVSHDAEEPVAYRFDHEDTSLAIVTDLGYVSDAIKSVLLGCSTFVFESNHDVEMLRAGRYPWSIKRRILGDKGHLSNHDAAIALIDLLENKIVDVYLAHLSEENNQPDLADLTVRSVLCEAKPEYGEQVRLHRTSRHTATSLVRLG